MDFNTYTTTAVIVVTTVVVASIYEYFIRKRLIFAHLLTKKSCFLVSDKNWPLVLKVIPIAYRSRPILGCWTLSFILWLLLRLFGTWISLYKLIRINPMLIYHEEDDGSIDADSIIYFLQQFGPDRIFLIGETPQELIDLLVAAAPQGAALNEDIIYEVEENELPEFWLSYSKFVLVDPNNYRAAQIGSVYASLKSIPIYFVNSDNLNLYQNIINNRTVFVVGEIAADVSAYIDEHANGRRNYTIETLTHKYISRTKTRKLLMINPQDIDIKIEHPFQPDKSANGINITFTKDSLAAPILASARHELIIFTNEDAQDYTDYNALVENYVNEQNVNAQYLTIIGSPSAIPQSMVADPATAWGHRLEFDYRYYGSIVEDLAYVDLAVGRIYGISPSDTSSNIARSLFYSYLPRNKTALVLPREDYQGADIADGTDPDDLEDYYRDNYWTPAIEAEFDTTHFYSGHEGLADNLNDIQDFYDESHLVMFADHGSSEGFSGCISTDYFVDNQTYLMNPAVIDLACSTGEYDIKGDATKWKLFNVQSIRRGAIVQVSAVSVSYWHQMFDEWLNEMYKNKKSLGEAFKIAKNSEYDRDPWNFHGTYIGDPWYFLMGDPVFKPKYW